MVSGILGTMDNNSISLVQEIKNMKLGTSSLVLFMISLLSTLDASQVSPHIITFYIRPLPVSPSEGIRKAIAERNRQLEPDKRFPPIISKVISLPFEQAGLYASYAGTLTHSDQDGQIVFERKSSKPKLYVLITDKIKAVTVNPLSQKTLLGFNVSPDTIAALYQFELLKDPETDLYAWNVTPAKLDLEKKIPYDTIILYAHPHDIIVPLGPTTTTSRENFILPDFYVTEGYNSTLNAINFLKVRQYFAPVAFEYTFLPLEYQKKIVT